MNPSFPTLLKRGAFLAATIAAVLSLRPLQLVGASPKQAPNPTVLMSDELHWEQLAGGVQRAILYGHPDQPGLFAQRLKYPAGYEKAPHSHPEDAFVTVLQGSYYRGYGVVFDKTRAYHLTEGTFSVNPAGVAHYEWTTGPTELQIVATGPWSTRLLDEQ